MTMRAHRQRPPASVERQPRRLTAASTWTLPTPSGVARTGWDFSAVRIHGDAGHPAAARHRVDGIVVQRQSRGGVPTGHVDRNRFNVLPTGKLVPIGDADPGFNYRDGHSNSYRDAAGLVWELLPDSMNEFHQPPGATKPYPNKKLLHRDSSGGSSEAIRQPDGSYLTTGPQRGTYNFVHPDGLWSNIGHGLRDILPHFVNDDYLDHPPLDPGKVEVDTYRQRYEDQVAPIGERRETNVTDPVDRTHVVESGVVWIRHRSGDVLVLARATNGRLRFLRFISQDLLAEALSHGQTRQPRGVRTIPAEPPFIFGVPETVPAAAARR